MQRSWWYRTTACSFVLGRFKADPPLRRGHASAPSLLCCAWLLCACPPVTHCMRRGYQCVPRGHSASCPTPTPTPSSHTLNPGCRTPVLYSPRYIRRAIRSCGLCLALMVCYREPPLLGLSYHIHTRPERATNGRGSPPYATALGPRPRCGRGATPKVTPHGFPHKQSTGTTPQPQVDFGGIPFCILRAETQTQSSVHHRQPKLWWSPHAPATQCLLLIPLQSPRLAGRHSPGHPSLARSSSDNSVPRLQGLALPGRLLASPNTRMPRHFRSKLASHCTPPILSPRRHEPPSSTCTHALTTVNTYRVTGIS